MIIEKIALNKVTATTTSEIIDVKYAKKVSLLFIRADHGSGKTVFSVEASLNGTTFFTYNKLIPNVANSNAQTLTRVASYDTGAANATALYSLDLENDIISAIKITATETTDGTHSAKVYIETDED